MRKFTTYVIGPFQFVETEKPDTAIVTIGDATVELTKDEVKDLNNLYYSFHFVAPPVDEPQEDEVV